MRTAFEVATGISFDVLSALDLKLRAAFEVCMIVMLDVVIVWESVVPTSYVAILRAVVVFSAFASTVLGVESGIGINALADVDGTM